MLWTDAGEYRHVVIGREVIGSDRPGQHRVQVLLLQGLTNAGLSRGTRVVEHIRPEGLAARAAVGRGRALRRIGRGGRACTRLALRLGLSRRSGGRGRRGVRCGRGDRSRHRRGRGCGNRIVLAACRRQQRQGQGRSHGGPRAEATRRVWT
ncbi:MAG: hypothetical protein F4016_13640 [Acidimicrobiaceae bacterium]|nr:hypothetical protein [Acidimicrobiaceae bacterium]